MGAVVEGEGGVSKWPTQKDCDALAAWVAQRFQGTIVIIVPEWVVMEAEAAQRTGSLSG